MARALLRVCAPGKDVDLGDVKPAEVKETAARALEKQMKEEAADTPRFVKHREETKPGVKVKQHMLYRTSANESYGAKVTEEALRQVERKPKSSAFTEWVARGHMRTKNMSLSTGLPKSRAHKMHDGLI